MIKYVLAIDRSSGVGQSIYNSDLLELNDVLAAGFIGALTLFTKQINPSSNMKFTEASVGEFRIYVEEADEIIFAFICDIYDNEDFISEKIKKITKLSLTVLNPENVNSRSAVMQLNSGIEEIVLSQTFPILKLEKVSRIIEKVFDYNLKKLHAVLLVDLDEGLIKNFRDETSNVEVNHYLEILSELPYEQRWVGETKRYNQAKTKELPGKSGLIISRVGTSEFFLIVKADYLVSQKRTLLNNIKDLMKEIWDEVKDDV
ncbi:MAG: hypothetical protein ACTSYA_07400 [Candidatus Kariarchaeaceae archaeon]